jgi:acetolactate synthase I/II/III large subunit
VNGAHVLLRTLAGAGVDVCFANPGTTEMYVVEALDDVPELRGVLTLFEGVATGAADGFARVAGRPAATLLHLGPGLANGIANLHNARRAHSPLVNIVGDHATYHKRYDAPLESNIEDLARPVSGWYRRSARADDLGADVAEAVAAASRPPGRVATLVVPADTTWSESISRTAPRVVPLPPLFGPDLVDAAAKSLQSGEPAVVLLGGAALGARGLSAASRVAQATGARLLAETFPAIWARGAGLPVVERLPYLPELAQQQLAGTRHLLLAGARSPVAFFAYPGTPSDLVPEGCELRLLAGDGQDLPAALEALADALGAPSRPEVAPARPPAAPTGALTTESLAAAVGAVLPEGAIVVDESNTAGLSLPGATAGAPRHEWLTLTGGAIGQGLPVATGAAVAGPNRRVLCLESDGSAMYTIQSLWTQARCGLDVTTVLLSNRSYAILNFELSRVRTEDGIDRPRARSLLDLSRPDLDFVSLATSMGVPACRAGSADELTDHLRRRLGEPGPSLIEAQLAGPG